MISADAQERYYLDVALPAGYICLSLAALSISVTWNTLSPTYERKKPTRLENEAITISEAEDIVLEREADPAAIEVNSAQRDTRRDVAALTAAMALAGLYLASTLSGSDGKRSSTTFAWMYATLLHGVRLYLARRPESRLSHKVTYETLEWHLITFQLTYLFVVAYQVAAASSSPFQLSALPILLVLFCNEIFASRPIPSHASLDSTCPSPAPASLLSRHASSATLVDQTAALRPAALQPGASIFALGTLCFCDRYAWRQAHSIVPASQTPELLPASKSATALLMYREDMPPRWMGGERTKLWARMAWFFRRELLLMSTWSWLRALLQVTPAVLLHRLLIFLQDRSQGVAVPTTVGLGLAVAICALQVAERAAETQARFVAHRMRVRMLSILMSAIFVKATRRREEASPSGATTEAADKERTGQVNSLISVDCFTLSELSLFISMVWPETPVMLGGCSYVLWKLLGTSAFPGFAVALLCIALKVIFLVFATYFRNHIVKAADRRLFLANEILQAMRLIKFLAAERYFMDRLDIARKTEMRYMALKRAGQVGEFLILHGSMTAIAISVFAAHSLYFGRDLDAATAFASLAVIRSLASALDVLSWASTRMVVCLISLRRLQTFLDEEETEKYDPPTQQAQQAPLIGFTSGIFSFSDLSASMSPSHFILHTGNLSFTTGQLSLVCGPVAAGKSALLLALLGEMRTIHGSRYLPGPRVRCQGTDPSLGLTDTVAYCAQTPFVLSGTLRYNVLGESSLNMERYRAVLDACALLPDIAVLDHGDLTEVGEGGRVLSGGQKSRIALARALYSSAQTILLDDVLSAVDAHTARHLYDRCLRGPLMQGRTCILVTHAFDLCRPGADFVVVMEDGRVVKAGRPSQIDLTFAAKLDETDSAPATVDAGRAPLMKADTEVGKLAEAEVTRVGSTSWSIFLVYSRAMGSWYIIAISFALFVAAHGSLLASNNWLREWVNAEARSRDDTLFYIRIYLVISFASLILEGCKTSFFLWRTISASRVIYARLLDRVFAAKSRFFELTPIGRTLNRMSQDISQIDDATPFEALFAGADFMQAIVPAVGVFFLLPASLPFLIAIVAAESWIIRLYCTAVRWWSALYALLGDLAARPSTCAVPNPQLVRPFKAYWSKASVVSPQFEPTAMLVGFFDERLSLSTTVPWAADSAPRYSLISCIDCRACQHILYLFDWLYLRSGVAGSLSVMLVAIYFVLLPDTTAANAGFVLIVLQESVWKLLGASLHFAEFQLTATALERIEDFAEVPSEPKDGLVPPAFWPSRHGSIVFDNLTVAYAEHLEPVLRNLSFTVHPGGKVAIVGRTGAGKSSLALSLFRFLDATEGSILIDGLDISKLNLHSLRRSLTIIPQDAALFSGSIRFNLDPFQHEDDQALWSALEAVGMAGRAGREGNRSAITCLEQEVSEGARNFSLGERQLLTLARGLLKLRSSSILILDEASASLDDETDRQIQATIRREMTDATILCIAHRLQTVIDYDKVLVLDQGRLVEYDTPASLLARPDSAFSALVRQSGHEVELKAKLEERSFVELAAFLPV